jgi:hypothetical protein
MIQRGQSILNHVTGDARLPHPSADTNGESVVVEAFVTRTAPSPRRTSSSQERLRDRRRRARVPRRPQDAVARPGDRVASRRTPHRFRNVGGGTPISSARYARTRLQAVETMFSARTTAR